MSKNGRKFRMIRINDFERKNQYEWELSDNFRKDMRVPVRIYGSLSLLEKALTDLSVEQAINVSTLPGLLGSVIVMPDLHQGYGFPIGGVAATSFQNGVISPGGIGYDINCGVRLLTSHIPIDLAKPYLKDLSIAINHFCPSGLGPSGGTKLSEKELRKVCEEGSGWALKNGFADNADILKTEDNGCLSGADFEKISNKASIRGIPQLGTLGSGNHFIEVGIVKDIFEEQIAQQLGLEPGFLTVMIHYGSRGLGHQVCSDYVQLFQKASIKYGINLPDRELVCAPLSSDEGKDYLAAMRSAANFAFCNRQVIAHNVGLAFEKIFAKLTKDWHLFQLYDIAHNIGKIENHLINGKSEKVCVHRKGATRAFGPGSKDIPDIYRKIGQPVFVPGSMGTSSWVLAGTSTSMEKSFGSCCHGAGRLMSRQKAKKGIRGEKLIQDLEKKGIHIHTGSLSGLAEESPSAYKEVDEVVEVVTNVGLAQKIARISPVVVVKG